MRLLNTNYFLQANLRSRRSISEGVLTFKYPTYRHVIFGRLSVSFGEYACMQCLDTGQAASGDSCVQCCEHGDYDHGICGICGADCYDSLVGAAEYAYEGER